MELPSLSGLECHVLNMSLGKKRRGVAGSILGKKGAAQIVDEEVHSEFMIQALKRNKTHGDYSMNTIVGVMDHPYRSQ